MPESLIVSIVYRALETAIIVSLPMLIAGLVAGVLVSIFQTVTSIQDNVLAFIPRASLRPLCASKTREHALGNVKLPHLLLHLRAALV